MLLEDRTRELLLATLTCPEIECFVDEKSLGLTRSILPGDDRRLGVGFMNGPVCVGVAPAEQYPGIQVLQPWQCSENPFFLAETDMVPKRECRDRVDPGTL